MIDQSSFHYQVECAPASAIIYVGGASCSSRDVDHLAVVADRLPPTMRVLRLDLHGVASMDLQALMDLRAMMARWRSARGATVRLLVREPLPRAEWPSSTIHFAPRPARLTLVPSRDSRVERAIRALHARGGVVHPSASARGLSLVATVP